MMICLKKSLKMHLERGFMEQEGTAIIKRALD